MKALLIGLILASSVGLFAAQNLSGDAKGKDKEAEKAAQLEKYTKYKVVSIGDGPVITVQKILSVPNPKKMGQPDIKTETVQINYWCSGLVQESDMESAKKFLAETLKDKIIKVVDNSRDQTEKVANGESGGISIAKSKYSRLSSPNDIVFQDGKKLIDLYVDWLSKQELLKKATTIKPEN